MRHNLSLPHDGGHLLWENGSPTKRLLESIELWGHSILFDDGITGPIIPEHDVALMARTDGAEPLGRVIARESGRIVGIAAISHWIELWFPELIIYPAIEDGDEVMVGDVVLAMSGAQNQMIALERGMLNLIARLSGIATNTHALISKSKVSLACTRKSAWGVLDKWAVHLGGGMTHRIDRKDARMIKENDRANAAPGGADDPLEIMLNSLKFEALLSIGGEECEDLLRAAPNVWGRFLTIEVRNADEALVAANWVSIHATDWSKPVVIMLDNTKSEEAGGIISLLRGKGLMNNIVIECSGGIDPIDSDQWGDLGADVISSSKLNCGVKHLDFSFLIDEIG